ncbi:hypothetical protein GCM10009754_65760 [Amycolatopsis minnesotensis]|uniref:Uncharacterized protein n=1 Tax=Amycolatopsis minnesotensis TaxID=337894 RepID=A0ABP5DGU3_9PSEU
MLAVAAGITAGSAGIASASMNQYNASAYASTEAFAVSQALYYAQQQGYAAGYTFGQCPESSHHSQKVSANSWYATVYVTCYRP